MKAFVLLNRTIRAVAVWLWLFFAVFAVSAGVPADTTAKFDAANKLYEQGRFSDAANAYETIRQGGVVSSALYFNLGNAYFKSAQIGRAIAAYRAAQQLAPRDPDVRANLRFARNQVQGATRRAGRVERWMGTLSLNEWTALAAGGLWLTCGLLIIGQIRPRLASTLRNLTIAAGVATFLLAICLGSAIANQTGRDVAIVSVREAVVRNGPLVESPNAFTANDGAEFRIVDQKDDWLQVTDDSRRTGWVQRRDVTLLPHS